MAISTVYTRCFIAAPGVTSPVVYTVPAGTVAIVTDVDAYSGASSFQPIVRFQDTQTGGTIWFDAGDLNADFYASWRGRQAFTEGQAFQVSTENHAFDIRVTGYLLDASGT